MTVELTPTDLFAGNAVSTTAAETLIGALTTTITKDTP